jgi:hypothetical protein
LKIKYEQKYLDDELKAHISELLKQLEHVASDEEENADEALGADNDEKENIVDDGNDEDYETETEDEQEEPTRSQNSKKEATLLNKYDNKKDNNNNQFKSKASKSPSKTTLKNLDEPMETT